MSPLHLQNKDIFFRISKRKFQLHSSGRRRETSERKKRVRILHNNATEEPQSKLAQAAGSVRFFPSCDLHKWHSIFASHNGEIPRNYNERIIAKFIQWDFLFTVAAAAVAATEDRTILGQAIAIEMIQFNGWIRIPSVWYTQQQEARKSK